MIDAKKWAEASDELKMESIKIIRQVMADATVTKADNKLITDFLIKKCESLENSESGGTTEAPESEEE